LRKINEKACQPSAPGVLKEKLESASSKGQSDDLKNMTRSVALEERGESSRPLLFALFGPKLWRLRVKPFQLDNRLCLKTSGHASKASQEECGRHPNAWASDGKTRGFDGQSDCTALHD
jgi:hypothetical protein